MTILGYPMTTPMSINRISEVNFEEGFTGNGKIFIHVEKQGDNSEKLVIYEAKNAFTGFFLNLFRIRTTTFTAREWAANSQEKLPKEIDTAKLIQNIKTAVSSPYVKKASQVLNTLVKDKKLDAEADEVNKAITLFREFNPLYKPGNAPSTAETSQILASTATQNAGHVLWRLPNENALDVAATAASKFTRDIPLSQDELAEKIEASMKRSLENENSQEFFKNVYSNLDGDALFGFDSLMLFINQSEFRKEIAGYLLSAMVESTEKSWGNKSLQAYVQLLIRIESGNKTDNSSPEQDRYLNTLKLIDEKLKKQSDPAAMANSS
jgi:hypothetical protein